MGTALRDPRIFHVNVNCRFLDEALWFYRDLVGLAPLVRTTPEPQPGELFGLDTVQWDGWILTGAAGIDDVALDLLQWKVPPPPNRGSYPLQFQTGFYSLRLAVVGDVSFPHAPGGVPIEFISGPAARLAGVTVACSDVGRSAAFYRDVLGLVSNEDDTEFSDGRGPDTFVLRLVCTPKSRAPRSANEVGIYRLAFLTDDIDRDHASLRRAGVVLYSDPVSVDLGPGLPAVRAVCFPDPDRATLELIQQPG